jgi:hypothetical protein
MIGLTEFALRHFNKKFAGTKILTKTPEEFQEYIQENIYLGDHVNDPNYTTKDLNFYLRKGEFEFSRLVTIPNVFGCLSSNMRITLENAQYLRSDYGSRTLGELPVLSRWFELPPPVKPPEAKFVTLVLYSKEQLEKETPGTTFESDWGIVAILAHNDLDPEPIPPITMFRNSLGVEQGGNGVPIDKEKYLQSVEFWKNHANIK